MNSSNLKLIEVMKKRLSIMNRNNRFINMKEFYPTTVYKLTSSKDYLDTNPNVSKKIVFKNYLLKDQINLKIVPLIKKNKCIFKYENLMINKNKDKKGNKEVFKCSKTFSKKSRFKSPFEEGKRNKYFLRDMVNFSKRFHSPKYKENKLHREILNTYSRNDNRNVFRISKNKNTNHYLKTWQNINHNYKLDKRREKFNDIDKNQIETDINQNGFMRNIIINKERSRRGKNYYNQIHVNKMNKIIEKYSFNNVS